MKGIILVGEEAEIIYKITKEHSPEHDREIIWNEPDVNIDWLLLKNRFYQRKMEICLASPTQKITLGSMLEI